MRYQIGAQNSQKTHLRSQESTKPLDPYAIYPVK